MQSPSEATVYRVRSTAVNRWDVFADLHPEPLATFESKGAALNYALSLARGRSLWQPWFTGSLAGAGRGAGAAR